MDLRDQIDLFRGFAAIRAERLSLSEGTPL